MVKIFLLLFLTFTLSFSQNNDKIVLDKIQTLISNKAFTQNKAYIKIIFADSLSYFTNNEIDSVKLIEKLKEHGLINLFFKTPRELVLNFETNGEPLFFVKIMGDTLRNIAYYRYVTQESNLQNKIFKWTISLNSEYATDPIILQKELFKSGCRITDVRRNSSTDWTYIIDMQNAYINTQKLQSNVEVKLKRSLYAYWLNVESIKLLTIESSYKNNWYPYIAFYDKSLKLLRVLKKDRRRSKISLRISQNTKYVKISDMYTLKNIKDFLLLKPSGKK
jgi:hypothetical protein